MPAPVPAPIPTIAYAPTPKNRKTKRTIRAAIGVLAAVPVLASLFAMPSVASASVACGPSKQTYHASSWTFKSTYFTDKGCIEANSSRVYATGSFRVAGTVGANSYTAHLTIKDMTTGQAVVFTKSSSWGEGGVNWYDLICDVYTYTSCPTQDTVIYTSGSVARVRGHVYNVWAWHDVDVMNDGKATFYDPQSWATWTAL